MIAIVLLLLLFIPGCAPARRPIEDRDRVDINQRRINENILNNDMVTPNERALPEQDMGWNNIPSDMEGYSRTAYNEAERNINSIIGILDSVVLVHNNTAYVGFEVDTTHNVNSITNLQGQVATRIREIMPQAERVYITSDMDRVERLRTFRKRVTNGVPIRDMIDEIEKLFS